jgi:hypothetical protein
LKRADAVTMLKEINSTCRSINDATVSLVESNPDDKTFAGYQLRIKVNLDTSDKESIKEILQKNNLSFKEEAGTLTIYKSKNLT